MYSLNKVLVLSQKWKERPFLEDRYREAQTLAASLLELHTVDWLHENLSAYNVILFNSGSKSGKNDINRIKALKAPFIISFSCS